MSYNSRRSPLCAIHGVAACSQHLVSEIGCRIMREGGNCVDAAVAMAAGLNVLEPTSTGIGGDAFCLYYDKASGTVSAMNASGRAPAALTIEHIQNSVGPLKTMPLPGEKGCQHTVTVPGACAGWCDAVEKWGSGTKDMAALLAPAIALCEEGFPVHELTANAWSGSAPLLAAMPNGKELLNNGANGWHGPREGDIWKNPNLAQTFREVAKHGKDGFYKGRIASELVSVLKGMGGVMTEEDLAAHTTTFPEPIMTTYRGVEVWEVPPNGQGLTALIGLNILEKFDVTSMGEEQRLHTMIESMRLAFADTQWYVTDTDVRACPTSQLLSKEYAAGRQALMNPAKAFEDVTYGTPAATSDTVYFCAADQFGNAVSFINSNYMGLGTGIVPKGCGFTLQNRGGNFSLNPAHPNALEPNKRPYHTIIPGMATLPPAIGVHRRELYCSFGVMGGFMQPQGHMQVISNMVDFGMSPQQALDAPRFCVAPSGEGVGKGVVVAIEEGVSDKTISALKAKGHNVRFMKGMHRQTFGRGQIIRVHPQSGVWWAGSDPRADGCAIGW